MYKHILFATDLHDDTDFIINKVNEMRKFTQAKLSLVHVVEPLPGYSYAYLGIEDIELSVDKKDAWVEVGPTKSKILSVAGEIGADLIICGSHGRHGLSLLLGSTANAILHGAKCDVLTVRLPE